MANQPPEDLNPDDDSDNTELDAVTGQPATDIAAVPNLGAHLLKDFRLAAYQLTQQREGQPQLEDPDYWSFDEVHDVTLFLQCLPQTKQLFKLTDHPLDRERRSVPDLIMALEMERGSERREYYYDMILRKLFERVESTLLWCDHDLDNDYLNEAVTIASETMVKIRTIAEDKKDAKITQLFEDYLSLVGDAKLDYQKNSLTPQLSDGAPPKTIVLKARNSCLIH